MSPDGSQLTVQSFDDTGRDRIWVQSLSANTQLRELAASARNPIWTPDGQRITFDATRDGVRGVYWQRADGSSTPELLLKSRYDIPWLPQSWSPDGRVLLVSSIGASGMATYTLGKDKEPQLLPHADVTAGGPTFSPDGKWIAYHRSTGAGPVNLAIHVQPFPPTGSEYRVSPDGRIYPLWRPGMNEIVYVMGLIGDDLTLAATSVTTASSFAVGKERVLPAKVSGQFLQRTFDVTRDGLITVVPSQITGHSQVNVVLNWFDELRQRVPVQ
jgi:Tol biopolymer transport system component